MPFDDPIVLAGQGTIGLEIAAQVPGDEDGRRRRRGRGAGRRDRDRDQGAAPRRAGRRRAVRRLRALPGVVRRAAADRTRSASTICDGIAVKRPGELTLPLVAEYVDEVVTVSDDEVAAGDGPPARALEAGRRGRRRGFGRGTARRQGRAARPRARSARCSPAATSTRRGWSSASGSARRQRGAGWCSRPSSPIAPARSRDWSGRSPSRART